MSYLDTLTRASKSPATDFHLCLLHHPSQRNEIYRFFMYEPVSNVWSRMQELEINLSNYERKFAVKSEAVYQLHLSGQKPQDSELVESFDEWAETYHLWGNCQKNYSNKFGVFQLETIDTKETTDKVELESSQIVDDSDVTEKDRQASSEQNGVEFLMSIAGIFDSGTSNTSENVKTTVSDFILRKHGKTRNGTAH